MTRNQVDYIAEFVKLRYIIESRNIAKIWVYSGRETFSDATCEDAQAYVTSDPTHEIRLCVKDESNATYKEVLINLLHEYGHILDEKRYGNTQRYKICMQYYPVESFATLVNIGKYIKVAIAKTEFMAGEYAKKIAKNLHINISIDDLALDQTAYYHGNYIKMVLGIPRNKKIKEFKRNIRIFKKNGIRVTSKNVDNLENLLEEK